MPHILNGITALGVGHDSPPKCIHSMIGPIVPCTYTEDTALVAHKSVVGEECEGDWPLLVNGGSHRSHFRRVAMNVHQPVILCHSGRGESVVPQRKAVATLAMRLARWGFILMFKMLSALATDVIRKTSTRGNASTRHHLHGPVRPAALAAIGPIVMDLRGTGCRVEPGENVLLSIPPTATCDAHASVDGGQAAECPAASAVALIVNPEDRLSAMRPLQLGAKNLRQVLGRPARLLRTLRDIFVATGCGEEPKALGERGDRLMQAPLMQMSCEAQVCL